MSHSRLSEKNRLQVWLRAGGRCQYPGCNKPLWHDEITLYKMNCAYLAHIVADKPGGPRGDPVLSPKLAKDPSNFMLLCDSHHRLIDKDDVSGHPVDLLREYKRLHEDRIERLTALQSGKKTHIVLFASPIGYRDGHVSVEQAREAVLPGRYPATDRGIRLDLCSQEVTEGDANFYEHMSRYVQRSLEKGIALVDEDSPHFSVFALAPIPALIYLGKLLGDIKTADVYQRHRCTQSWKWREKAELPENLEFIVQRPSNTEARVVVIDLSLSNTIDPQTIRQVVPEPCAMYRITIAQPCLDFLATKDQLEQFRSMWRKLLSEIRSHGQDAKVHVFPAVPNAIAVEMGRLLLPKSDNRLRLYDFDRDKGGFSLALQV